ncbi:class I SAM-dependent methyltransferase [Solidesulfovibrio alcoholivorans]|uniref:class I SAM-dependent methyltransferase n=1 Tax=Solidesulfovibrio alcoholivorans TaxID=81406 RepID=UPI00049641F4|nr:class I SAM-dependent methyltransferase [Solidesulfovibrio alcoholivorans]
MPCLLCGGDHLCDILTMPDIEVFVGGYAPGAARPDKLPCRIRQCLDCGHVFQPADPVISKTMDAIYNSVIAQASTATGVGQWGRKRAERMLSLLSPPTPPRSVLEIGSPNAYLLRRFQEQGATRLVGLDPSLPGNEEHEGVQLLKAVFGPDLPLSGPSFDLILACNVFEHIENMHQMLRDCRKWLADEGMLSFCVPNCEQQLVNGDPAVFMHEHWHYFTEHSIRALLARNGFSLWHLEKEADNLYVQAVKSDVVTALPLDFILYDDYRSKLSRCLERFTVAASGGNVLIHGASNSLNNILGWVEPVAGKLFVTDNDPQKYGKRIGGFPIRDKAGIPLTDMDVIVVIPYAYAATIRNEYERSGYKGRIAVLVA